MGHKFCRNHQSKDIFLRTELGVLCLTRKVGNELYDLFRRPRDRSGTNKGRLRKHLCLEKKNFSESRSQVRHF
ncbi:hypothetical protein EBQ74_09355 [bacterium]|nr:hypothetical protein [bacterium]